MNKNTAIFLIGSIGMILGWNWVMSRYYSPLLVVAVQSNTAVSKPGEPASGAAKSTASSAASIPVTAAKSAGASLKPAPEQLVSVSTTAYEVSLSTWGARLNHLKLRGVTARVKDEVQALDLITSLD